MLIAIAIAEEFQEFGCSASFELLSFLWIRQEVSQTAEKLLAKVEEISEAQKLLNLHIFGSLLQWRWQWASIGHFVFLFVWWYLVSLVIPGGAASVLVEMWLADTWTEWPRPGRKIRWLRCRSGNSEGWPKNNRKPESRVNTDLSLTLFVFWFVFE